MVLSLYRSGGTGALPERCRCLLKSTSKCVSTNCRRSTNLSPQPHLPSGEEETVAKGRTPDAIDGTRVPVVSLEVLLVVADGTLMDQSVLGAGEVRGAIAGREVERQPTGLPRNHALRVACNN